MEHKELAGTGRITHTVIDARLPTNSEKDLLHTLRALSPLAVTGARDETEGALKALLAALTSLGLITDSTTAS